MKTLQAPSRGIPYGTLHWGSKSFVFPWFYSVRVGKCCRIKR